VTGPAVAVFGGSFNPPHVGHVLAAAYVLSACDIDAFVVIPCFIHPFAKELASFDDRLQMCRLAFGSLPGVRVSDVERRLGGESRTLRTLEHLAGEHPEWRLRLVLGSDVLGDVPRWYGFERIRQLAPPIVLGRIGYDDPATLPSVLPDVSSTRIREAIGRGQIDTVRALLPRAVADFVEERGLFAPETR